MVLLADQLDGTLADARDRPLAACGDPAADAGRASDKFTIDFAVTGAIDLQSPLPDLNNTIAIQGPGAGSLTVHRDAGYSFASAILTVDAGRKVSLSGLTIADGNRRRHLQRGDADGQRQHPLRQLRQSVGGGIYNDGTLTVSGSTLSGNSADWAAAASSTRAGR